MVDTMIRLFESTATTFLSNGLGNLPDASKCEVTEERNGSYELEMEYHISGRRYSELGLRRIIVVKPNPYAEPQPFRIYSISRPMNGLVTVKAEHISYDMSGYPVASFEASDVVTALSNLKNCSIADCPFEFSTTMSSAGEMKVLKPESMRSLLGGSSESILDIYGGEYEFNGYKVILHASRGRNQGVTIRYGKNMTDLKQEENCSNVYTAVYPFWYSDEWGLIELPEKTIALPGTYNYTRILPLDLSSDWENNYEWEDQYPSEDEIRELGNKYISDNNIGIPAVSLTVSFEQLSQSGEYKMLNLLETVHLCDIVGVEFPKLKVSATAKCIKTVYNVLTGKYVSIELGESRSNLASAIASNNDSVDEKLNNRPTKSFMAQAVEKATLLISGGLGGYVIMRSSTGGSHPDEILIMDTPDIETATKVWRWNKGGLGYSDKGYNGPYRTAITQDGEIVADFVKTGNLTASIIHGGIFTVGGIDNTNGTIEIRDANGNLLIRFSVNGIEFYGDGGKTVTKIVNDTLTTTNIVAENLRVTAANVIGKLVAEQINTTGLIAENISGEEIIGKKFIGGSINIGDAFFVDSENCRINGAVTARNGIHFGYTNQTTRPPTKHVYKFADSSDDYSGNGLGARINIYSPTGTLCISIGTELYDQMSGSFFLRSTPYFPNGATIEHAFIKSLHQTYTQFDTITNGSESVQLHVITSGIFVCVYGKYIAYSHAAGDSKEIVVGDSGSVFIPDYNSVRTVGYRGKSIFAFVLTPDGKFVARNASGLDVNVANGTDIAFRFDFFRF